jgi:hypothetical protein
MNAAERDLATATIFHFVLTCSEVMTFCNPKLGDSGKVTQSGLTVRKGYPRR